MNDINSLVIEGVVKEKTDDYIVIRSYRMVKKESGELKQIGYSFKACGSFEDVGVGFKVRIVGKLITKDGEVFVLSEHTEIRKRSKH